MTAFALSSAPRIHTLGPGCDVHMYMYSQSFIYQPSAQKPHFLINLLLKNLHPYTYQSIAQNSPPYQFIAHAKTAHN